MLETFKMNFQISAHMLKKTNLPLTTVESFDVKGDATLASPRRTSCDFSSSSKSFKMDANFFWKYMNNDKTLMTH